VAASADDGTAGAEPADTDAGADRPTSDSEAEGVIPRRKALGRVSAPLRRRQELHRHQPDAARAIRSASDGKGAAFTRANRPHTLAAVVWFESRSAAASMEAQLKTLARPAKLAWFKRFAATTATVPATLDVGLASLTSRPLISST